MGDLDFDINLVPLDPELQRTWKESLQELYTSMVGFFRDLSQNSNVKALKSVTEFQKSGMDSFQTIRGKVINSMEQLLEAITELTSALSRAIASGIRVLAELTRTGEFGLAEKLTYLMDQFRTVLQITSNLIMPPPVNQSTSKS